LRKAGYVIIKTHHVAAMVNVVPFT
jgi:hypothetical protein